MYDIISNKNKNTIRGQRKSFDLAIDSQKRVDGYHQVVTDRLEGVQNQ